MSEKTWDGFIKREMSMAAVPDVKGISAGIVKVMAQGNGVVYVEYRDGGLFLQHRDHDYHGSTHLTYDATEKTWEVMGKPYFSRDDHKDVTTAAAGVLTQALYRIVKAFVERYPDDMKEAEFTNLKNQIAREKDEREKAAAKVREHTDNINALLLKIEEL